MEYFVAIDSVCGTRTHQIKTRSVHAALDFLHDFDHEGSSVLLRVEFDRAEEAYEFLREQEKKSGNSR